MKVSLILGQNPFFASSAGGNRALTLIEGLRDLGCTIELLFTIGYHTVSEKEQLGKLGEYRGVSYKYFNPNVLDTLWKRRIHNYVTGHFYRYQTTRSIKQHLNNEKTILWSAKDLFIWQIIHDFKLKNPEYPLFLELSEFLDIHHFNKGNMLQRKTGDAAAAFFERKLFPLLDGFALMTKTLITHFSQFPGQKPQMLHLPMTVDLERFTGQLECLEGFSKPYIAFVGVMNDAKDGVSCLIKSFNKIIDKYPKHKVYLVGGWNYDTPTHLKLIKEYGLEDRVFWMKEYPRDQIPNIICNADLLALPRPDSKQAKGGFPTKLGEYLATGNPVCATTVGEIPDYLVDNESVFFAEPGSVESFAHAMDRALSDPENAKRVGMNGRKVAEKAFNKDMQAKKLYDFLITIWEN
jgi:glycosyltransferase involved in cell wall biosynthesis